MQSAGVVEDKIFQALADPSRRAIFESLTRGEAAVKDLTARFDISQPAVSQHLTALKDAGLVNGRREGRCAYYRVHVTEMALKQQLAVDPQCPPPAQAAAASAPTASRRTSGSRPPERPLGPWPARRSAPRSPRTT